MKSKRFTDEQIIKILQEAESGLSVVDVCRKHNCSEQSFYRWKVTYDRLRQFIYLGMTRAKRMAQLYFFI